MTLRRWLGRGTGDIFAFTSTDVGAVIEGEMKLVFALLLDHLVGQDHQVLLSKLKDDLEMLFVDLTGRALMSVVRPQLSLN